MVLYKFYGIQIFLGENQKFVVTFFIAINESSIINLPDSIIIALKTTFILALMRVKYL